MIFDIIKRAVGRKRSVDIEVEVCPDKQRDALVEACDNEGIDRWLYAGTPTGSEKIWLLSGEADEPYTGDSKEKRVVDAISHETMHAVLSFVEDDDTSRQYDDMIQEVLPVTTYLHHYARLSEVELEVVADAGSEKHK